MTRGLPQLVGAVVLFCLSSASPAAADPITFAITDGFLLGIRGELAPPSTITGPGVTFTTTVAHTRFFTAIHAFSACDAPGCAPGAVIGLGASLSTQNSEDGLIRAMLTLNGVQVDDFTGGQIADNIVSLAFSAGSAIVPPFNDSSPVTLTAPFTMGGFVFLDQNRLGGGDFFALTGRGIATLRLRPAPLEPTDPVRVWEAEQVRYDFESAAPVPEPATMLLMGTGLAALVRSRRRSGWRRRTGQLDQYDVAHLTPRDPCEP